MLTKSQMVKGLLEGCILEIIYHGKTYGYKITEQLSAHGFEYLNEASVYSVLMRLSKKGYIIGEVQISPKGPKRKYFTITDMGTHFLEQFKTEWDEVSTNVTHILKGGATL